MRHRLKGRKLGRPMSQRALLARNLVNSLFIYGRIVTTVEKAKEFRSVAEKLITRAKKGGLANYRHVLSVLPDREVARKLFKDIAPRFSDRNGGYTRIIRLGGNRWDGKAKGQWAANRLGDNGARAIFELVVQKTREEELKAAGIEKAAKEPAKNTKRAKEKAAK